MLTFPTGKDIVFIDVEANDKPKRLLQFGAIKLKKDGQIEKQNWFSNPKCKITNHVFHIVKKNIEKIRSAPNNKTVTQKIYNYIDNCVFVSYSPFDYSFINNLCETHLKKKVNVQFIDLQEEWKHMSLSKNVLALNKLADFFKIKYEDDKLHDAFYDASIMYQIYEAWKDSKNVDVLNSIYHKRIKEEKLIKSKQNKSNPNALTINNTTKNNGYVLLDIDFKNKWIDDKKESMLTNLSLVEIQSGTLRRNWNFFGDINSDSFDYDEYEIALKNKLKDFIISTRNKKIIVPDGLYQQVIKLANLCAEKINVFPINSIIFSNGFDNFYNNINVDIYKYENNLDLIRRWKVFEYLIDKYNETY